MASSRGLGRALLAALIAYVVLDFGNPLHPGAVNFDDDETVLAARSAEPRSAEQAPSPAPLLRWVEVPRPDRLEPPRRPVPAAAPAPRPPRHSRAGGAIAPPAPDASDDH